jgi:hypothetical protein
MVIHYGFKLSGFIDDIPKAIYQHYKLRVKKHGIREQSHKLCNMHQDYGKKVEIIGDKESHKNPHILTPKLSYLSLMLELREFP